MDYIREVSSGVVLDATILWAAVTSAAQLFIMCGFAVWLFKAGLLPQSTPQVLSQAAFNIFTPCFLLSKVAVTVATEGTLSLAVLPLVAMLLMLLGLCLGVLACNLLAHFPLTHPLVAADNTSLSSHLPFSALPAPTPTTTTDVEGAGPRSDAESVPGPDLRHGRDVRSGTGSERGLEGAPTLRERKEGVIKAACAFGNTLGLPLVLLNGVLNAEDFDKAAGYLALVLIIWSPLLFTVGGRLICGPAVTAGALHGSWLVDVPLRQLRSSGVVNPPTVGTILGLLIGITPLWHLFDGNADHGGPPQGSEGDFWSLLIGLSAGILAPVMKAATVLGTGMVPVQVIVLATSLGTRIKWPSTPTPSISLSGSRSSRSKQSHQPSSEGAAPSLVEYRPLPAGPPQLEISTQQLSASNALSVPSPSGESQPPGSESVGVNAVDLGRSGGSTADEVRGERSVEDRGEKEGEPSDEESAELDDLAGGRAFWAVAAVRIVAMPLASIALVESLNALHLLPSDPIAHLTLMTIGSMPSAQNLVVLSQLNESSRKLAGPVADLMLRLYSLAVIPLAFWMAAFLATTGVKP